MPLILSGDTGVPASGMPTGSVIQTVQTTINGTTTSLSTNATWTDVTGFTASITPISSSSKILIMVSAQWELYKAGSEVTGAFKILRGSTDVFVESANSQGFEAATSGGRTYMDGRWNGVYLDSPATTSSTTYKLQFRLQNSGTFTVNSQGTQTGTVLLQEIKG
jgi:hypothetical protein